MFSNQPGDSGSFTLDAYNNSIQAPCGIQFASNSSTPCPKGASQWTNNIFIGGVTINPNACSGSMSIAYTTHYNMSASEASQYGFTSANLLSPPSSDPNTVAKGTNLTTSCSGTLTALCQDASGTRWFGKSYVSRPANSDLGAYQLAASSASQPAPPTALIAKVE